MKTIVLARHAKAVKNPDMSDFDRPLTGKGETEARSVAEKIRKPAKPDVLISSPAVRALETARIFATVLDFPSEKIMKRKALYAQGKNTFRVMLREFGDRFDRVMIIGHNPSISEFARTLASGFEGDIPTAGVVAVEVDTESWKELPEGKGKVLFTEIPGKITGSELRKQRRRDIEGKLTVAIVNVLAESDRRAAEEMGDAVLQMSRKLAGKFVKKSKSHHAMKPETDRTDGS